MCLETNEAWRSSGSRRLAQSLISSDGLNKTSGLFSYNGAWRNGTGNNQVEDSQEKECDANYYYLLKLLLDFLPMRRMRVDENAEDIFGGYLWMRTPCMRFFNKP
jgi:hypothetical protein